MPAAAAQAATATAPPQYMLALERANAVRLARSKIKRRLAALGRYESREHCAKLLLEPPEVLGAMRAFELVMACRFTGLVAARRIFRLAEVSEARQIGVLTTRQREALAYYLAFR